MDIAIAANKTADAALDEVGVRRKGLGYSLIGIAIVIVALVLKIRDMESQ
jgi:hypothetical protein